MCGIFCAIGSNQILNQIFKGLHFLEYRGYDSSGIAFINSKGVMNSFKTLGGIQNINKRYINSNFSVNIGIGHTRWGTHGTISIDNTHPIHNKNIAVVHNGIIENFQDLKAKLVRWGYDFYTDTDTEVILNMIQYLKDNGHTLLRAIQKLVIELKGRFAICILDTESPDQIYSLKLGLPLIVSDNYISSDISALGLFENKCFVLEDGDIAIISRDNIAQIYNHNALCSRDLVRIQPTIPIELSDRYQSYMQQEIHEQSQILSKILYDVTSGLWQEHIVKINWTKLKHIVIIGCGSSYNAGMVAKYWFESIAFLSVEVAVASEFRFRDIIENNNTLYVFISQSGETLDTLIALKKVKEKKSLNIALVNTLTSSISRIADYIIPIDAGIEQSVAATKSFTAQLCHLLNIAVYIKYKKNFLTKSQYLHIISCFQICNDKIPAISNKIDPIDNICRTISIARNVVFVGRREMYPLASEGALKLRELSYLPVHSYPAGELKHGSISTIDHKSVVIVLAIPDRTIAKLLSDVEEIKTRGARVIAITSTNIIRSVDYIYCLDLPKCNNNYYDPVILSIPLQMIALKVANKLGRNIDRPRNLAKAVTV